MSLCPCVLAGASAAVSGHEGAGLPLGMGTAMWKEPGS